jgi:hypothetical protein
MPRLGCEPMILVFERAKTFHTLDRSATLIHQNVFYEYITFPKVHIQNQLLRPDTVTTKKNRQNKLLLSSDCV